MPSFESRNVAGLSFFDNELMLSKNTVQISIVKIHGIIIVFKIITINPSL